MFIQSLSLFIIIIIYFIFIYFSVFYLHLVDFNDFMLSFFLFSMHFLMIRFFTLFHRKNSFLHSPGTPENHFSGSLKDKEFLPLVTTTEFRNCRSLQGRGCESCSGILEQKELIPPETSTHSKLIRLCSENMSVTFHHGGYLVPWFRLHGSF